MGNWHKVELAALGMNRAHNARSAKDEYRPAQWLHGRNYSLSGSLMDSANNLAAQRAIEEGTDMFQQWLQILKDCGISWVKAGNGSRVRRAVQTPLV